MQQTDEHFMRRALIMAHKALEQDELPVGAVITHEDAIIAEAHKFKAGNFRLDHAEMLVLRSAFEDRKYKAEKLCIYTTLEPCPMCFGALLNCRVPRIVYAMEDLYGGVASIFHPHDASVPIRHQYEHPEIVGGILREQARDLFRVFFETTENKFWSEARANPLKRSCLVR